MDLSRDSHQDHAVPMQETVTTLPSLAINSQQQDTVTVEPSPASPSKLSQQDNQQPVVVTVSASQTSQKPD